jgi:cohesin loading factor subunit SCC2
MFYQFLQSLQKVVHGSSNALGHYLKLLISRYEEPNEVEIGRGSALSVEYKACIEEFLADVLQLIGEPEWPIAQLACIQLISILYQKGQDSAHETGIRSVTIQWLEKLGLSLIKIKGPESYKALDLGNDFETELKVSNWNQDHLNSFACVLKKFLQGLDVSRPEIAFLHMSTWASQIDLTSDRYKIIGQSISSFAHNRNFQVCPNMEKVSKAIVSLLFYDALMENIVKIITHYLPTEAISVRVKCIKALDSMQMHSNIELNKSLSQAICERLYDPSSSVRDVALDWVSKVVDRNTSLDYEIYLKIAERSMDVSTQVRKKSLKIMQGIFLKYFMDGAFFETAVDIFLKTLFRLLDEEVAIVDQAMKMIIELWFNDNLESDQNLSLRQDLSKKTEILAFALAKCTNQRKEELFERVLLKISEKSANYSHNVEAVISSSMGQLANCDESEDKERIEMHLQFLLRFCKNFAELFTIHVSNFSSFLKLCGSITLEIDQRIVISVLRILQKVLPVSNLDKHLIASIERETCSLLSNGSQTIIENAVPCLCVISKKNKSHVLDKIFLKCMDLLSKYDEVDIESQNPTNILRCILISSLLIRYDDNRTDQCMNNVYQKIAGYFDSYKKSVYGPGVLAALGHVLMGYKSIILKQETVDFMQEIFTNGSEHLKTELVKLFVSLIEDDRSENKKSFEDQKLDIDLLVGNTSKYIESGICGSILQRFLEHILDLALNAQYNISKPALTLLILALEQGLIHPVMVKPILCSVSLH